MRQSLAYLFGTELGSVLASLHRRVLEEQSQAVKIWEEEAVVASFCLHWSLAHTGILMKAWPSLLSLAHMGKALPICHGPEALIFVTCVPVSIVRLHSGLDLLRISSAPYRQCPLKKWTANHTFCEKEQQPGLWNFWTIQL